MTHTLPEPAKAFSPRYGADNRAVIDIWTRVIATCETADDAKYIVKLLNEADTAAPVGMKSAEAWTRYIKFGPSMMQEADTISVLDEDMFVKFVRDIQQDALRSVATPVDVMEKATNITKEIQNIIDDGLFPFQAVRLLIWEALRSIATGQTWKCAAKSGNTGANDPQDCDWPVCGCDPQADKVIAALQEMGFGPTGQTVPDGWQLVPKEPTTSMIAAGQNDFYDIDGSETWTGMYKAMLAAAPSSGQTQDPPYYDERAKGPMVK